MEEYASVVLDLAAREARDLVWIGKALRRLPLMAAAMELGELEWTKARELIRVVDADTEASWLARSEGLTSRALEDLVRGRKPGELPPAPESPEARGPPVRRFSATLESADYDMVRAALAQVRADLADATAEELEEGDLLGVIVREWIASRYRKAEPISAERDRVVVDHCPSCRDTHVGHDAVADHVAAEAACDAEVVELRPGPAQGHVTRTIPLTVRRQVLGRARWRCDVPGSRSRLWLDVHHVRARMHGGTHDPRGLAYLCAGDLRAVHRGCMGVSRTEDGRVVVWRAHGVERVEFPKGVAADGLGHAEG
jgi:hypothetical protein